MKQRVYKQHLLQRINKTRCGLDAGVNSRTIIARDTQGLDCEKCLNNGASMFLHDELFNMRNKLIKEVNARRNTGCKTNTQRD